MGEYPDSHYSRTRVPAPVRPPLEGAHEAEVCVIGAGLAGLTTALELQKRARATIVLERDRIGWGASGRNGGFVGAGFAADTRGFDP